MSRFADHREDVERKILLDRDRRLPESRFIDHREDAEIRTTVGGCPIVSVFGPLRGLEIPGVCISVARLRCL